MMCDVGVVRVKFDQQLLSWCGSAYSCESRSVPGIHFVYCWDVRRPTNNSNCFQKHQPVKQLQRDMVRKGQRHGETETDSDTQPSIMTVIERHGQEETETWGDRDRQRHAAIDRDDSL